MSHRLTHIALALALTSTLLACDGGSKAADAAGGERASSKVAASEDAADPAGVQAENQGSASLFDEALRKQPCELLTPEMVAKVAKVPAESLERLELASMCNYEWEGGQAGLGMIRVSDTAEQRREAFARSYVDMSGEHVKDAMAELGEATKDKLEADNEQAGAQKVDPAHVDPVTKGIGGAFAGGISYKAIEGLADAAMFETTKTSVELGGTNIQSYANTLMLLSGNMSFNVSYALDSEPGSEPVMYEAENVALAREVLAGPRFQ